MEHIVQYDGFFMQSALDGFETYIHRWQPKKSEVKGLIVIAHGMVEHAARYDEFAEFFVKKGYALYAPDHLGHGKTAEKNGIKGYFAPRSGWEYAVQDIETVRKLAQREYPDMPVFLFGHSMGSLLARTHMTMYPKTICLYILSGPAHNPDFITKMGSLLAKTGILFKGDKYRSKIMNELSFGKFSKKFSKDSYSEFDWLCRDREKLDLYINDENCGFIFTLGGFRDLLGGMAYSNKKKHLSAIKDEKVLLVAGSDDPVSGFGKGVAAISHLLLKFGAKTETKIFDGLRHEIINEPEKYDVFELINHHLDKICVQNV